MKNKLILIGALVLLIASSGCIVLENFVTGNSDAFVPKDINTKYDDECEEVGDKIMNEIGVFYSRGFICGAWLEEEAYYSKSMCSCYRGKTGTTEAITYYRSSGEIIIINKNVRCLPCEDWDDCKRCVE